MTCVYHLQFFFYCSDIFAFCRALQVSSSLHMRTRGNAWRFTVEYLLLHNTYYFGYFGYISLLRTHNVTVNSAEQASHTLEFLFIQKLLINAYARVNFADKPKAEKESD